MHREHKMIPVNRWAEGCTSGSDGHFGPPLLVFPSAAGMAHEWEAHGMVEALEPWLETGKLKLYCTETNGPGETDSVGDRN